MRQRFGLLLFLTHSLAMSNPLSSFTSSLSSLGGLAWRTSTQLAAAVQQQAQQLLPASQQRRVMQVIPVGDENSPAHRQHRNELSPPLSPDLPLSAPPQHPPDGDDTAAQTSRAGKREAFLDEEDDDLVLLDAGMQAPTVDVIPAWTEAGYPRLGDEFKLLNDAIVESLAYFVSAHEDRLYACFKDAQIVIWNIEPLALSVARICSDYDFPGVRANGYRSLLNLVRACVVELLDCVHDCKRHRGTIWASQTSTIATVNSYSVTVMHSLLSKCLQLAISLHEPGSQLLFVDREFDDVFKEAKLLDRAALLGRFVLFFILFYSVSTICQCDWISVSPEHAKIPPNPVDCHGQLQRGIRPLKSIGRHIH